MYLQKVDSVEFDPNNKQHRKSVLLFLKRRAWGDSPIRFKHNPEYGSVTDQVQSRLTEWYLAREFSRAEKKAVNK